MKKRLSSSPFQGVVSDAPAPAGDQALDPPSLTDFLAPIDPSPRMQALRDVVREVARTDATVLVRGESGVGKNMIARAIHAASVRRAGPFVLVNCAALPGELLESELFGH